MLLGIEYYWILIVDTIDYYLVHMVGTVGCFGVPIVGTVGHSYIHHWYWDVNKNNHGSCYLVFLLRSVTYNWEK